MAKMKPRPTASPTDPVQERRYRLRSLRAKLAVERTAWSRWMARLKRAFDNVERLQQRIARIESEIEKIETA